MIIDHLPDPNSFSKFKNISNNISNVSMHRPFITGDVIYGVYIGDAVHLGPYGLTSIIIILTEDGEEVGVCRNTYLDNAIKMKNAEPGYYISIKCIGEGFTNDGKRYNKLDVLLLHPSILDQEF